MSSRTRSRLFVSTPILIPLMRIVLLTTASTTHGECWFETVCDHFGNCQDVRICDTTADTITPPISDLYDDEGPLAPVLSLPPVGTAHCHQIRRCDSRGCFWDQVCY